MPRLPMSSKKQAKKEVESNLIQLEFLRTLLGEKKFEKRIKKASRLLTGNLPKSAKQKKNKETVSEDSSPQLINNDNYVDANN
jgi:hypothetical protein